MILSFIIPVYNRESYIEECIKKITAIESSELEIILIDDGSKDGSLSVCKKLAKEDDRIFVIAQKNKGVSAARNSGIRQARGTYLAFVDSDDTIVTETYRVFLEGIYRYGYDLYCYNYYEQHGNQIIEKKREFSGKGEITGDEWREYLFTNRTNAIWDNIYKKELIDRCGIWFPESVRMGEDLIFNLYYAQSCRKIGYYDTCNYIYRTEVEDSAMTELRLSYVLDYIRMDMELDGYYGKMKPDIYHHWMVFYLNMICKILLLSKDKSANFVFQEFEDSRLQQRILQEKFSGNKLKFKKLLLQMKGYRSVIIRRILCRLIYS